jgi:hypothetical protein
LVFGLLFLCWFPAQAHSSIEIIKAPVFRSALGTSGLTILYSAHGQRGAFRLLGLWFSLVGVDKETASLVACGLCGHNVAGGRCSHLIRSLKNEICSHSNF